MKSCLFRCISGIFNDNTSRAAAIRANGLRRKLTKRSALHAVHDARAVTFRTSLRYAAFCARTFAVGAIFRAFIFDFFFATERRFFKRERKV